MFENRSEFKSRTDSDKNFITKDSMLRFGDDLTELILSYLTLEDKIRLECVSKQWQRLVFNKQFEFGMNFIQAMKDKRSHWTMKQMLESLLKKCPNIMKAELITTFSMKKSEVLPLIGRYCPRIKSLVYHLECSEKKCFAILSMLWSDTRRTEPIWTHWRVPIYFKTLS